MAFGDRARPAAGLRLALSQRVITRHGHSHAWLVGAVFALAPACVGGDAPANPFDIGNAGKSGAGAGGGAADSGINCSPAPESSVGSDAGSAPAGGSVDSHFPLADGARWTYHHENPNKQAPWDENDTTAATTDCYGKPTFILMDQEDAQGEQTSSTLVADGSGVYRVYKEVAVGGMTALKVNYDPAFLRYDESWMSEGTTVTLVDEWKQTCVFSSTAAKCGPGAVVPGQTTHIFTVLSMSTQVTVAAGTFDAIEIERVNPDAHETKHFWFAAGVGKVREEDVESGGTEELTDYDIPR
jgi:hypothetical protein